RGVEAADAERARRRRHRKERMAGEDREAARMSEGPCPHDLGAVVAHCSEREAEDMRCRAHALDASIVEELDDAADPQRSATIVDSERAHAADGVTVTVLDDEHAMIPVEHARGEELRVTFLRNPDVDGEAAPQPRKARVGRRELAKTAARMPSERREEWQAERTKRSLQKR